MVNEWSEGWGVGWGNVTESVSTPCLCCCTLICMSLCQCPFVCKRHSVFTNVLRVIIFDVTGIHGVREKARGDITYQWSLSDTIKKMK